MNLGFQIFVSMCVCILIYIITYVRKERKSSYLFRLFICLFCVSAAAVSFDY